MRQMSEAAERLSDMARACEYYADAYVLPDAPFPDRIPSQKQLCEQLQEISRLAHEVLSEYHNEDNPIEIIKDVFELLENDNRSVTISGIVEEPKGELAEGIIESLPKGSMYEYLGVFCAEDDFYYHLYIPVNNYWIRFIAYS